tara:strand:+ start:317 stop:898 length:582 start_codon:yes stop_codon:yes gene_type:complete
MEFVNLAKTCRTLYDKDYLDNMKKLDILKRHPMIKFDNLYDYFHIVNRFQLNIKQHIQRLVDDSHIFENMIENIEWLNDDIIFIKHLQKFLKKELMKITNHKYSKWCGETVITTVNSIKGALKGLGMTTDVNKNNVRDMIICIVFSTYSTNDNHQPILDKISFLKCFNCKKFSNQVVDFGELICLNCSKTVHP